MKNKKIQMLVLGIVCLLLVCGAGYTIYKDKKEEKTVETSGTSKKGEESGTYLTYNGERYKKDASVRTVLFMGVDKTAQAEVESRVGQAGQADSLNLLVMNGDTKEAHIMQISRDSMVDIDVYDESGEKLMTAPGQIALQYAYGDGKERSCRLTGERVSELLGGVRVNGYLSLTLDGIGAAVDAVGGVEITVPMDYTDIDPAFTEGALINMDGAMAERYVRSRDTEELDSNNQRMERQSQFMEALVRKMQSMNLDSEAAASLYNSMSAYMTTNMTADEMWSMTEYTFADDSIVIPGEVTEEGNHAQYIVNKDDLKAILVKCFYKKVKM